MWEWAKEHPFGFGFLVFISIHAVVAIVQSIAKIFY